MSNEVRIKIQDKHEEEAPVIPKNNHSRNSKMNIQTIGDIPAVSSSQVLVGALEALGQNIQPQQSIQIQPRSTKNAALYRGISKEKMI